MFRIKGYNGNAGMEEPEWVKRDMPIDDDIADLTWAAHNLDAYEIHEVCMGKEIKWHEPDSHITRNNGKLVARVRATF